MSHDKDQQRKILASYGVNFADDKTQAAIHTSLNLGANQSLNAYVQDTMASLGYDRPDCESAEETFDSVIFEYAVSDLGITASNLHEYDLYAVASDALGGKPNRLTDFIQRKLDAVDYKKIEQKILSM